MKRIFLSLLLVFLPLVAEAADVQRDILPSMQYIDHDDIRMLLPSRWRQISPSDAQSNYVLYTPLSRGNKLSYITGIQLSQSKVVPEYSTLGAAVRTLQSSNANIRILSTKNNVTLDNVSGFDIEFVTDWTDANGRIEKKDPVHQWWRFAIGNDAMYVVGLNGSEKTYRRFLPLFRRLLRTVEIVESK